MDLKERKWTPGPWECDLTKKYYGKPCIRHNGMIVCFLPEIPIGLNGIDERIINSELITMAPALADEVIRLREVNRKLVEACKDFFSWHANHFEDFDDEINKELLCLANQTESALSKAEGGKS